MSPTSKIRLICFLLVPIIAISQEKEHKLFLRGYIKNLHEFHFEDKLSQLQWTTQLHNRLNFEYEPLESMSARLELRNRVYYGDAVSNVPGFSNLIARDNGWIDLTYNLVDKDNIFFTSTIDRAMISYSEGKWDITLGRQRVNWGKNLIWNPNDIFNTYNFLDFDYEERPGSDAIRLQYYTGNFSKVELAAKKGRLEDDHIIALLYGCNQWSYDLQFIAGIYQNDWVIGTGWAGNLKSLGFKGELSYFIPYKNYIESKNIFTASISLDYGFKNGFYLHGSTLFNGSASNFNGGIENLSINFITAKNLMPFEFSSYLQLSKEFSPLLSGSFSAVYSPTNHSVIAIPNINYSITTDLEVNLLSQSFFEFKDYRSLSNRIYLRFRWSF